MFEKKKSAEEKKPLKFTTFGNDSDEESEMMELPSVDDFMATIDGEIKSSKQREKNATIAQVYSSSSTKQKPYPKNINACGCFGG